MKGSFMKLVSLFVSTAFVTSFAISCGGGGGGGSSDPGPYTYSEPGQAGSSSGEAADMMMMLDSFSGATSNVAIDAAGDAGYAAPKQKIANMKALGSVDPRLKTAVENMAAALQSASVQKATAKARLAKANQKTVSFTESCDNVGTGTITVTGTDNSDLASAATYSEATVTLTFTQCRTNFGYIEENGTMQVYWKRTGDGSTVANLTATNYDYTRYTTSGYTSVYYSTSMNGTFNVTDNLSSGSIALNGSFIYNYPSYGYVMTLTLSNLTSNWTHDVAGAVITDTVTLNGNYTETGTDGTDTGSATIGARNLQYKVRSNADSTVDEWMNGGIVFTFSPASCAAGTVTFTTAEATPLHFANYYDDCPDSGTLQVNNATIMFKGLDGIDVTVNGVTENYSSCSTMEFAGNGICM